MLLDGLLLLDVGHRGGERLAHVGGHLGKGGDDGDVVGEGQLHDVDAVLLEMLEVLQHRGHALSIVRAVELLRLLHVLAVLLVGARRLLLEGVQLLEHFGGLFGRGVGQHFLAVVERLRVFGGFAGPVEARRQPPGGILALAQTVDEALRGGVDGFPVLLFHARAQRLLHLRGEPRRDGGVLLGELSQLRLQRLPRLSERPHVSKRGRRSRLLVQQLGEERPGVAGGRGHRRQLRQALGVMPLQLGVLSPEIDHESQRLHAALQRLLQMRETPRVCQEHREISHQRQRICLFTHLLKEEEKEEEEEEATAKKTHKTEELVSFPRNLFPQEFDVARGPEFSDRKEREGFFTLLLCLEGEEQCVVDRAIMHGPLKRGCRRWRSSWGRHGCWPTC